MLDEKLEGRPWKIFEYCGNLHNSLFLPDLEAQILVHRICRLWIIEPKLRIVWHERRGDISSLVGF
jgi:hypothetical protein